MWIINEEREYIVEFIRGLFAGIVTAGKTREEAIGTEYWFNWNCSIEVQLIKNSKTGGWQAIAYQCNDYSQYFGNESEVLEIGENWK